MESRLKVLKRKDGIRRIHHKKRGREIKQSEVVMMKEAMHLRAWKKMMAPLTTTCCLRIRLYFYLGPSIPCMMHV